MLKNIKNNPDNKFNKIVEEKILVIYKTSIENHNKESNKNNKQKDHNSKEINHKVIQIIFIKYKKINNKIINKIQINQ